MNNNKPKIWLGILIAIVLLGLFIWPKLNNPDNEKISKWDDLDIECLTNGHSNPAQHIHPNLEILIGGQKQIIPTDIGITKSCMAEVHTHDDSGKIHIESNRASKQFILDQFFALWGEKIEKDGYNLEMTVDNQPNSESGNLILRDNQKILLKYEK